MNGPLPDPAIVVIALGVAFLVVGLGLLIRAAVRTPVSEATALPDPVRTREIAPGEGDAVSRGSER